MNELIKNNAISVIWCIVIEKLNNDSNVPELNFFVSEQTANEFAIAVLDRGHKVTKAHYPLH